MADDWWAQLYDEDGAPLTPDRPAAPEPDWWRPGRWLPGTKPDADADAAAGEERLNIRLTRTRPENESIPDAARAMLPADPRSAARLRWAAYNAGAAAAGWWIGAEQWCAHAITASGRASVPEGVWVGVGLILVTLPLEMYAHRTRGPGPHPLARFLGWIARIPLASAVLALALYGPNAAL